MTDKLAFDQSMRTRDENGHLHVERTVLSKAAVNPYYGREIPNYESLGLDPDRIYHMLRCPIELAQAADTFATLQLLLNHTPVDAGDMRQDLTVGTTGSNITFENNKLYGDLTVWHELGIELIESEKMKELSAGYSYRADMTGGTFEGMPYDGIMRDIKGNHIALVERGRIGKDAVISDSLPFEMGLNMKLKKGTQQLIAARLQKIAKDGMGKDDAEELIREVAENLEHKPAFDWEALKAEVGDEAFEKITELVGGRTTGDEGKKAEDEQTQAERDNESEAMRLKEREEREREDRERDEKQAKDQQHAMDAAIGKAAADIEARITGKYNALEKVRPLVGKLALDGFADAEAVYRFTLKQKGIACDGINEAGLKALVDMQVAQAAVPVMAQDSAHAATSEATSRFKQR